MDADERKAELQRLRVYVAELQPLLRLQHWEIAVIDEIPPGNACADCSTYITEHRADLRFASRYFSEPPSRRREIAVHELVHVVVEHWHRSGLAAIEGLNSIAQIWAQERHGHDMEMAVDTLGRIIAPHMPLPPTEGGKEAA